MSASHWPMISADNWPSDVSCSLAKWCQLRIVQVMSAAHLPTDIKDLRICISDLVDFWSCYENDHVILQKCAWLSSWRSLSKCIRLSLALLISYSSPTSSLHLLKGFQSLSCQEYRSTRRVESNSSVLLYKCLVNKANVSHNPWC